MTLPIDSSRYVEHDAVKPLNADALNTLLGERDELRAEVDRLRAEVDSMIANGYTAAQRAENDRLLTLIGEIYVQRGQDVNTLRTAIRRAFREATQEGTAGAPR